VSFCRCSLFYEEGQGPERAAAETPWPLLLLDENREAGAGTSGSAVEDTCLLRTFLDASELLPGGHVFSVPGAGYCDFFPRKTSRENSLFDTALKLASLFDPINFFLPILTP
jgi:hypothetical protein